jgi:hypothetical protein
MGAPDWLSAGQAFVSQWHDPVYPAIDFKGYDLHFSADNLFGAQGVKAPRGQMRGFEITEFGPSEEPDVVANFTVYAPFSTDLWSYLGQYGGDTVWCSFTPGLGESGGSDDSKEEQEIDNDGENDEDEGDLDPDNETETGDDPELDKPEELEYEDGPTLVRSGPKELAAFHETVVDAEQKRGRGRPKKIPQGFSKPLHSGNEF